MKVYRAEAALSPVVFHTTSLKNFENIMRENKFYLTPTSVKNAEMPVGSKMFFLSTARNRASHYISNSQLVLTLDGVKLNQNHSGKAVDYWGEDFRKIEPTRFEQEDRLFSDKPYINNAAKYITRIDVMVRSIKRNTTLKLLRFCKLHSIQLYFYDDQKAYNLGNKSKALPLELIIKAVSETKQDKFSSKNFEFGPHKSRGLDRLYWKDLDSILVLIDTIEKYLMEDRRKQRRKMLVDRLAGSTNKEAKRLHSDISRSFNRDVIQRIFRDALPNRTDVIEKLSEKIYRVMKRRNVKSFSELEDYIKLMIEYSDNLSTYYRYVEMTQQMKERVYGQDNNRYESDLRYTISELQKKHKELQLKYRIRFPKVV